MCEEEYVVRKSLPPILTRWWLKTRKCEESVQIGPEGVSASIEFYIPWWAWLFELLHRLVFGRAVLD
jgi:hypothetical protein